MAYNTPPIQNGKLTVRLSDDEEKALIASAAWRRISGAQVMRTGLALYLGAQAEYLLRAGHASTLAELGEDETVEDALAEIERRRADIIDAVFGERAAPKLDDLRSGPGA